MDEATIKYIAVLSMLIDHIAFCLNQYAVIDPGLYTAMRIAGRLAFPLFCYTTVQGVLHTENVKRYILRLLVFACLSEIPFDLMSSGAAWNPESQNVLFTPAISAAMLFLLPKNPLHFTPWVWQADVLILAMISAVLLKSDYSWIGPALVFVFYISGIRLDNGKRGRQSKYFFYLFYPLHMLILWFLFTHGGTL